MRYALLPCEMQLGLSGFNNYVVDSNRTRCGTHLVNEPEEPLRGQTGTFARHERLLQRQLLSA